MKCSDLSVRCTSSIFDCQHSTNLSVRCTYFSLTAMVFSPQPSGYSENTKRGEEIKE